MRRKTQATRGNSQHGFIRENNLRVGMKKYFSLRFVSRLILGSIFVGAGLYKIIYPESFEKTLHAYNFPSNSFTGFIALIFPWIQLILGAWLISGYLARFVASIISILLLIFIVTNILFASIGNCRACGFLSELVILKGGSPFILLTINYLLLALSATIIMSRYSSVMSHK